MDQKKKIIIEAQFKDNASKGINDLGAGVNKASGAMGGMAAIGGKLIGILGTAFAVKKVVDFSSETLIAGASLDRLEKVTLRLGENMGVSNKEIDKMIKGLEDTNTFGINAYTAVSGFLKSGLLPMVEGLKATDKATGKVNTGFNAFVMAAKDIGAAAGVSSGEAIQRLTQALVRQDVAMLESLGIQVSLEGEYRKMAKSLGKTTMQLTEQERSQALLNAVMREGAKLSGVYSDTYDNLLKNLSSFKDLNISIASSIGRQLLPPFQELTNAALRLGKAFRGGENEGLVSTLPQIGQSMDRLMSSLAGLASAFGINNTAITEFGNNLGEKVGMGIADIIDKIADFVTGLQLAWDEFKRSQLFIDMQTQIENSRVLWEAFSQGFERGWAKLEETMRTTWDNYLKPALTEFATEILGVDMNMEGAEGSAGNMGEAFGLAAASLTESAAIIATALLKITTAMQKVNNAIGDFITLMTNFNFFAQEWQKYDYSKDVSRDITSIQDMVNPPIGGGTTGTNINKGGSGVNNLLKRQSGGLASGWTMVGEHGAELLKLPQGSKVMSNNDARSASSGGGITINIQAPVYGVDNLQSMIVGAVNKATAQQNRLDYLNIG